MMQREKLFTSVGDTIDNFFGLPKVRVAGILAPTNTAVDDYHFLGSSAFSKLNGSDFLVTESPSGGLKFFYLYDNTNVPPRFKSLINPLRVTQVVDGKNFLTAYIGYDEAAMMKQEKLFTQRGDTINNLFGNDIIIVGTPKKSYTLFDMFHFVPKSFKDNYIKSLPVPKPSVTP
jgi:hypothetical protein